MKFYSSFLKLIVKADAKMFSSCDLKSCKWAPNMVWEPVLGMLSHVSRKGFSIAQFASKYCAFLMEAKLL